MFCKGGRKGLLSVSQGCGLLKMWNGGWNAEVWMKCGSVDRRSYLSPDFQDILKANASACQLPLQDDKDVVVVLFGLLSLSRASAHTTTSRTSRATRAGDGL